MLGCMSQKQQVHTQALSTNTSRINGCLNYLTISKSHFKNCWQQLFLLVCRQANWNHKALYENWLGIFLFCWSACSCERKNSSLTKQPTGEILHLQSIASAFVLYMVYSPSNISSYDYLRKENCMLSFSKIPLFIQRKKRNSKGSELLLKTPCWWKPWGIIHVFLILGVQDLSLKHLSNHTLNSSHSVESRTEATTECPTDNTAIDNSKCINLTKKKEVHYFWSKAVFQQLASSGRPCYSAESHTQDV